MPNGVLGDASRLADSRRGAVRRGMISPILCLLSSLRPGDRRRGAKLTRVVLCRGPDWTGRAAPLLPSIACQPLAADKREAMAALWRPAMASTLASRRPYLVLKTRG